MAKTYQTPGVYIEEKSAFPNSAVPVATAVPAFIGYTEKAVRDKKPLTLQPTKISSYGEYLMFFGGAPTTKLTVAASTEKGVPYKMAITESYFTLHSQMKIFFSNGGNDCYIVSVGGYTKTADDGTESPNTVDIAVLKTGIDPLQKELEPTMLVIPEAVNATVDQGNLEDSVKAIYGLHQEMLKHCGMDMRSRFAIMDVWMNRENLSAQDYDLTSDIDWFREGIGTNNLQWGAAYYPWLETTILTPSEVSVLNVANLGEATEVMDYSPAKQFNERGEILNRSAFKSTFLATKVTSLTSLLEKSLNQDVFDGNETVNRAIKIKAELKKIAEVTEADATSLTQTLLTVSPMFKSLMSDLRKQLNLLPPSGAMAGIYSMVDNSVGVFQSPANVSVGAVIKPALSISNDQQEDLNMPLNGKAVNAIRFFPGKGVLVWGARTLDGNSQDWRYISVRRTVIFIEQSVKYAAEPYVFEPNTASTWSNMKAMLTNFLTNVWQSGALAGATAEDAFSVDVGLGTTMTPADILDGYMRISIKIAVTRPAEFIVITFEQKMQQS
ncbi:phage tail sheath family protein [Neolewinella persica]|uniref:phage tail sheath family protein n=1 Tax=Neolewinella persica TaxID=70998 RepID=UPI000368F386|nr:phage tail sheath C-terminal domain-containing protein [Neolewinella persica]